MRDLNNTEISSKSAQTFSVIIFKTDGQANRGQNSRYLPPPAAGGYKLKIDASGFRKCIHLSPQA